MIVRAVKSSTLPIGFHADCFWLYLRLYRPSEGTVHRQRDLRSTASVYGAGTEHHRRRHMLAAKLCSWVVKFDEFSAQLRRLYDFVRYGLRRK